ncbi:MAG: oligosaccharide repeat unit polymerase [Porphyrobacter sp.]|nr:oligosaccharide repeat unit polymerase [Porphyrobacter sp.]
MNAPHQDSVQEHVKLIYGLFVTAAVISCLYCVVMGQFNGDFFPQPVFLSVPSLLIVMIACLVPYFATWKLAGALERLPPRWMFEPSQSSLLIFMLAGFALHIAATVLYGVGVLDREFYSAPPLVVPFIQVLNRLDPYYLGVFYILATPKRTSTDLLAISLMMATGLLRAGVGAFVYIIIALTIKYRFELLALCRRMPWLIVGAVVALPTIVSALYEVRGRLRGDASYEYSLSEMMLGRFVGRLSSFSNVAYIEQFSQSFAWSAKSLEPFYFAKQALVSLFGSSIAPGLTPERLLIAGNRSYEGYSTFMAGVPGNLYIAWYISPWVASFNLFLIVAIVTAVLWMSRYFGSGLSRTFGIAMLVYPLTSGVANEFSSLLFNTAIFLIFAVIFGSGGLRSAGHHGV